MHRRALIATRAFALLAACANPAPKDQRFAARLHARSTSSEPVPDTRFWANGRDLGATQAKGQLDVQLRGREGDAIQIRAACPPAFRTQTPERQLVLRHVGGESDEATAGIELVVTCEPLERVAALVVLATGPGSGGLPIRVGGELVGQTEPDGTAHLLVTAPPRSALRIELDTSERAPLRPRTPVHSFRLEDEDTIVLVEQAFTEARPPRPARRPARARPPPTLPHRIR